MFRRGRELNILGKRETDLLNMHMYRVKEREREERMREIRERIKKSQMERESERANKLT